MLVVASVSENTISPNKSPSKVSLSFLRIFNLPPVFFLIFTCVEATNWIVLSVISRDPGSPLIVPAPSSKYILPSSPISILAAVILPLALILPEAVISPVKFKLSLNSILLPPVAEWKASAYIVPEALISPEAVILCVSTSVNSTNLPIPLTPTCRSWLGN